MNANQPFEQSGNKKPYRNKIYQDSLIGEGEYDYSQVEDIAGVDYKKAMIITGVFIAIHLFAKPYLTIFPVIWIFGTTGLSVAIWVYFKQYFDAMNDRKTGKWLQAVVGGIVLYGLINLFGAIYISFMNIWEVGQVDIGAIERIFKIILQFSLIPIFIIFVAGIKIISVNFKHPFPLKRIAVSAMFIIPIYMLVSIIENTALFGEVEMGLNLLMGFLKLIFGSSNHEYVGFGTGFWGNIFLMIPYFFLLHHFYRAEMDDATP